MRKGTASVVLALLVLALLAVEVFVPKYVTSVREAKELTLGCASRNITNQLFAKATSRKPTPAFVELVASASAIIFTLPKDDMRSGTTRCLRQLGFFNGDDVSTRYRRLDMRCFRTKTNASITISRSIDG